jgi:hypothetical protein
VPQRILQVFIIILLENELQNHELFPTQVSLSTEQSTLDTIIYISAINKKFFIGDYALILMTRPVTKVN